MSLCGQNAGVFPLSTWCASLSARPLLRWSYALDASESANEETSLMMRGAAKRSKKQTKSKAAAFLAGSALHSACSRIRGKPAMGRSRAQPLRFLGVPKGAVLSQRIAPFAKAAASAVLAEHSVLLAEGRYLRSPARRRRWISARTSRSSGIASRTMCRKKRAIPRRSPARQWSRSPRRNSSTSSRIR